jgi:hypothetical protein
MYGLNLHITINNTICNKKHSRMVGLCINGIDELS